MRKKANYVKIDTEYSFLDDKVFKLFMEDKEVAKNIIEIIIKKEIADLEYIDTEKEIPGLGMERSKDTMLFVKMKKKNTIMLSCKLLIKMI